MREISQTRSVHYAVFLAVLALAGPASAQSTNCRWIGSTWACNTNPAPQPIPPVQIPSGTTMIDAYSAGRADRARSKEVPPPPSRDLPLPSAPMSTGNGYLEYCTSNDSLLSIVCLAYTKGLVEGFIGAPVASHTQQVICPPEGVNVGQERDVAVKYMTDNPEYRHLMTSALVLVALQKAFPCPAK